MERIVCVEPILGVRFKADVKDVAKAKKALSFLNASNCCHKPLKEVKRCSECQQDVDATACQHKLFKVGKEMKLIPTALLEQAKDAQEATDELRIKQFIAHLPRDIEDRMGPAAYLTAVKKHGRGYKMLVAALGRVPYAIGSGWFRGYQYEFVVRMGSDGIVRLQRLVEQMQMYPRPESDLDAGELDAETVELVGKVAQKKAIAEYDFTAFRDQGIETTKELIEKIVDGEQITVVVPEFKEQQAQDEKEQLKALLNDA
jgi:hypothetical protein